MSKRKAKHQASPEAVPGSDGSGRTPAKADYEVGYGRPPDHTRFKKGRSGNPRGRPQGRTNARSIVSRAISEKVTIREGDKARDMTKLEGLL
jgi:hypothetical protein